MVGGFNTNVRYKGRTFHVQTEDSDHGGPKVVTLLYEGGVILHSRKQAYEGDRKDRNAVRERMEAQHAEMLKALKAGELDVEVGLATGTASTASAAATPAAARVAPAPATVAATPAPTPPEPRPSPERKIREFGEGVIGDTRLDELILARFSAK